MTQLYPMTGGLLLPTQRAIGLKPQALTEQPPRLVFALQQRHLRYGSVVKLGQLVFANQVIAQSIGSEPIALHTGLAGQVTSIDDHSIELRTNSNMPTHKQPIPVSMTTLKHTPLAKGLRELGLLGLGGAGFPTALKIHRIHTLLINGVECEPLLVTDASLMTYHADQIIQGLYQLLTHQDIQLRRLIIAIEADKPQAITAMRQALQIHTWSLQPELIIIPTRYPAGGERQLYQQLFGEKLPAAVKMSDQGVACLNVHTLLAINNGFNGQPLTHRLVSILGNGIAQPQQLWLPIGTPISWLLTYCGALHEPLEVRIGGPIMGQRIDQRNQSITANANTLIVDLVKPTLFEQPCIACGQCEPVCPEALAPQDLIALIQSQPQQQDQQLVEQNLPACIECGVCDLVCPSHIPLHQYFGQHKSRLKHLADQQQRAQIANATYTRRQERLAKAPKPNPKPPIEASRFTPSQPLSSKANSTTKLKTNLAKAQRLYREAQAALKQAEKKGLEPTLRKVYESKVGKMHDKVQLAQTAFDTEKGRV